MATLSLVQSISWHLTSRFVASKVFPIVPVEKQSDKYFIYTKNDWFRDEAQLRGDAQEAAGGGYNLSSTTYSADVYAIRKDVGDQVMANADAPLNPIGDAARWCAQKLLLRQELQWVTDSFSTSIWTTDVTGGSNFTVWSDQAGSDPLEDIEAGKEKILKTTGHEPNTLVLGYQVFRKLRQHPDLVDRIKYVANSLAGVSESDLAQAFHVDRVLVASAVKATNTEGQTGAFDFSHGKHALLCYVASSPGTLTPSAGYTFVWRGVSDGMGLDVGTKRYRIETLACNRVESQMAWDNKIVGADLGYFYSGAVS